MDRRLARPIMVVGGGGFGHDTRRGVRLAAVADGLGLIPGSDCPHYDGEPERRPTYHAMVASGELPPGLAIDDFAVAIFDGPDLIEVVAADEGRAAYRVERTADGVVETPLPVRLLAAAAT